MSSLHMSTVATCPTHGHMTLYMLLFIQDEWGSTALIRACGEGQLATADLLINKGANVNYLNKVRLIVALINVWSVLKLMSVSVMFTDLPTSLSHYFYFVHFKASI